MAQLIMNWKNDGTPVKEIAIPEGIAVVNFPNLENALSIWADIIPYLNAEYGSAFIRIDDQNFVVDNGTKEIFIAK